ncbi:hypothetical protein CCHR01_17593 [Colletotrichum chrysophilum]|uniref:Uncharacterized protein n=1 Tax=Colletotrichum chrysophilum TaxID=1836956 RepID=A0AAD9A445_9PEZI|nr:hypothetical protein CCHR01_17593 [Colletotrichum chrysophilum]
MNWDRVNQKVSPAGVCTEYLGWPRSLEEQQHCSWDALGESQHNLGVQRGTARWHVWRIASFEAAAANQRAVPSGEDGTGPDEPVTHRAASPVLTFLALNPLRRDRVSTSSLRIRPDDTKPQQSHVTCLKSSSDSFARSACLALSMASSSNVRSSAMHPSSAALSAQSLNVTIHTSCSEPQPPQR